MKANQLYVLFVLDVWVCTSAFSHVHGRDDHGLSLNGSDEFQLSIEKVLHSFNEEFNSELYNKYRTELMQGAQTYKKRKTNHRVAFASYSYGFAGPHCDKGAFALMSPASTSEFPGGITNRILPDFSKQIEDISANSFGGAGGELAIPFALGQQALQTGMGLVQTIAAAIVHIVPPLIAPPVWINMPLPCTPMITGHNCFGAVLYPITMADFMIADMTDKVMDGYIAGFPNTYASKVGTTDDAMYRNCFSAYMSMHCSSLFPRCTTPMARDEALPVGGRVPLCLHLCILPLVMCPGFWVGDIIGACKFVSVPPLCTQAFFWNLWRLPPQYRTYDQANPFPKDCPKEGNSGIADSDDPKLYDETQIDQSPIQAEAEKSSTGVPTVEKLH